MNPYESRRLARRIHQDRARRIEALLIRFAANGDLSERPTLSNGLVLAKHYVWCDFHGEIHKMNANPYALDEDECGGVHWRPIFVASTDPNEEF